MSERPDKAPGAFRTISELAEELGVPPHRLRYWETRFPDLRPIQRAGLRRYYRAEDVRLARRIHRLLSQEGYTVRGVQRLLAAERRPIAARGADSHSLAAIRDLLAAALAADRDQP